MKNFKAILTGLSKAGKRKKGSHPESPGNEKPFFITLEEAQKDPALLKEIAEQLNEASIVSGTKKEFVAGIVFKGRKYYISGSQSEWLDFYGMGDSAKM